jgi:small subunit ribosomal protein S23
VDIDMFCFLSAVRFALNLHQHHDMPLSRAYAASVAQFRSLRSEQEVANMIATLEAEYYGADFLPTETERGFNKEIKALETWHVDERYDQGAIAARKRWKAVVERVQPPVPWTAGQEYVRLWREGIRPNYSAALTGPVSITPAGLSPSAARDPDFMQVLQKS